MLSGDYQNVNAKLWKVGDGSICTGNFERRRRCVGNVLRVALSLCCFSSSF